jgi:RES domain-containing protein
MHDETTLRAALLKVPPASLMSVLVTRFVFEKYRSTAASPIGASKNGGRYNSPGTDAVYTSFHRSTALLEFTQRFTGNDPIAVASMLNLSILRLQKLLDVTDPNVISALRTSIDELTQLRLPRKTRRYPNTWRYCRTTRLRFFDCMERPGRESEASCPFLQNLPPTMPFIITSVSRSSK